MQLAASDKLVTTLVKAVDRALTVAGRAKVCSAPAQRRVLFYDDFLFFAPAAAAAAALRLIK